MLHTLLYFLALFCLSTSPNWAKLNQMPVETLGFYRLTIAALLIGLFLLVRSRWRAESRSARSLLWPLLSGLFFFLHLWTYKYAAKNTSVSNTMIIFSSNPIWASIGAMLFFKEHFARRLLLSYAMAIVGIYLLVAGEFRVPPTLQSGDMAAVFSAFLYAAYMLTGKKARQSYGNIHFAFIQYTTGALLFLGCVFWTDRSLTGHDATSWWSVFGLVLLPTLLGHLSLTYLVNHMDLSLMTCGKLIEPVLASVIAYIVFSEQLAPMAWLSFCLTAGAVLVLFAPQLQRIIVRR